MKYSKEVKNDIEVMKDQILNSSNEGEDVWQNIEKITLAVSRLYWRFVFQTAMSDLIKELNIIEGEENKNPFNEDREVRD